jgi:hypothetical protein
MLVGDVADELLQDVLQRASWSASSSPRGRPKSDMSRSAIDSAAGAVISYRQRRKPMLKRERP